MFRRSFYSSDRIEKKSGSSHGAGSMSSRLKKTITSKDHAKWTKVQQSFEQNVIGVCSPTTSLTSPIVTIMVGREGRLFAAHEDVLALSPYFAVALRELHLGGQSERLELPHEEPEILSSVLEYLYKGDYFPCLVHNKRKCSWELEKAMTSHNLENIGGRGASTGATSYISSVGEYLLKDTIIYCAAEKYGLDELKRLALKKQGLQSGIEVSTILRSARYAYDHTPDSDSRLRAHYLALIIRCRKTFKKSGTMQAEMESGGRLFFDLFVALCNHVDDIVAVGNASSPRTI